MASPVRARRGGADFEKETSDFMRDVEMNAKRILRAASKRRTEELQREKVALQRAKLQAPNKKRPLPGSSSPGKDTPVTFTLRAPDLSQGHHGIAKTDKGAITFNKAAMTMDYHGQTAQRANARTLVGPGSLSPGSTGAKTKGASGVAVSKSYSDLPTVESTWNDREERMKQRTVIANSMKISDQLRTSPLFSPSMDLDAKQKKQSGTKRSSLAPLSPSKRKGPLTVEDIYDPQGSKLRNNGTEAQGPVSWSADDLRVKYRGEEEREEAWRAFLQARIAAKEVEREENVIVAVPEIDRHPVFNSWTSRIKFENEAAISRARAHNRMKRFVSDVHQLWITSPFFMRDLQRRKDGDASAVLSSQVQSREIWKELDRNPPDDTSIPPVPDREKEEFHIPGLPKPLENAPEMECLVYCKDLDMVPGQDEDMFLSCTINRMSLDHEKGKKSLAERFATPLWDLSLYDSATGDAKHLVVRENAVLAALGVDREENWDSIRDVVGPSGLNQSVWQGNVAMKVGDDTLPCQLDIHVGVASVGSASTPPPESIDAYFKASAVVGSATGRDGPSGGADAALKRDRPAAILTVTLVVTPELDGNYGGASAKDIEIAKRMYPLTIRLPAGQLAFMLEMWNAPAAVDDTDLWQGMRPVDVPEEEQNNEGEEGVEEGAEDAEEEKEEEMEAEMQSIVDWNAVAGLFELVGEKASTGLKLMPQGLKIRSELEDDTNKNAKFQTPLERSGRIFLLQALALRLCDSLELLMEADGGAADEGAPPKRLSDLKLIIRGLQDSSLVADEPAESWETLAGDLPPLSFRVSGKNHLYRMCPGISIIGKRGLWTDSLVPYDNTRPVALFVRDPRLSSTESVTMTLALALENPSVTPAVSAWESDNMSPQGLPDEPPEETMPLVALAARPFALNSEPLISVIDERMPPSVMVLSTAPVERDWTLPNAAKPRSAAEARQLKDALGKHRRQVVIMTDVGFRVVVNEDLLVPNPHIPTVVYGVTQRGAQANASGVTYRNTWHSEQRAVEQLCRARDARDYAYVITNKPHHGPNDPSVYTLHLKHEVFRFLARGGLSAFQAEYDRRAAEAEQKAKEEALAAKIEAGKRAMEERREREALLARQLQQQTYEKRIKAASQGPRSKGTREEWRNRAEEAYVVAEIEGWQKLHNEREGCYFYFSTDPYAVNPFFWDPPMEWEEEIRLREEEAMALNLEEADAAAAHLEGEAAEHQAEGDAMAGDDQGTIVASVVDEMLNNEELLKTLATRLGLPAATVSRGSMTLGTPEMAHGQEDLLEPPMHLREPADNTGRTTLDLGGGADGGAPGADADAWSDSDDEAGMDLDGELPVDRDGILMRTGGTAGGFALPQDHRDVMLLEHAKREAEEKNQPVRMSGGVHDNVPPLDFRKGRSRITGTSEEEMSEQHIKGMGWRRLPRANLRKSFVGDSGASRTHGPWLEQVNTLGELHSVGMIAPVDAVDYEPDTSTWADPVGTRFVSNVFEDINRVQQGMMKRIEREEKLAQGGGLSQLKMAAATGLTSGDVLALSDGDGNFNEPTEADVIQESEDMAILAARHSNIEKLEEALDNQISVDTTDEHGNTLLMIAGQQGDKRLIKFLLRRGADVHAQNLQGNSVLHYCYEYGHTTLGEYLISKGADSTLLNAQGLTCFEGLSAHNLEKL